MGLVLIIGLVIKKYTKKYNIPLLVYLIILGIILSPSVTNLIPNLNYHSNFIRELALYVILFRAGMGIDSQFLKRIKFLPYKLGTIPALLEVIMVTFVCLVFGLTPLISLLLAIIIAATSPAVIVPKMLKLSKDSKIKNKDVPKIVMLGSSIDDIFIALLFTIVSSIVLVNNTTVGNELFVIIISIYFAKYFGCFGSKLTRNYPLAKWLIIGVPLIVKTIVDIELIIVYPILGYFIRKNNIIAYDYFNNILSVLWDKFLYILLFVLIGSQIDINIILNVELLVMSVLILILGILVRMLTVKFITRGYSSAEQKFMQVSYIPKATVQATLGGVILSYALVNNPALVQDGQIVLAVSTLAILLSAPIGSILIDRYSKNI